MLLSVQQRTRGAYQALFRDKQITKHYDAIAPWREDLAFPREHMSRLEESPQFFRMQEVPGEPNSHTQMQMLEVARSGAWARYRLMPITGKRHQLRVHMAALGLPLRNDFVDVLRFSRRYLPFLPDRKQTTVAAWFRLNTEGAHRALRDCELCDAVYRRLRLMAAADLKFRPDGPD